MDDSLYRSSGKNGLGRQLEGLELIVRAVRVKFSTVFSYKASLLPQECRYIKVKIFHDFFIYSFAPAKVRPLPN